MLSTICLLLITLSILFVLVVIVKAVQNINININVKLPEPPTSTPLSDASLNMIEPDPDIVNMLDAARQIQELFLDDSQLSKKQEVKRNARREE